MPTMLRRWQRKLQEGGVFAGPAAKPPILPMASPADQASEIARLRCEHDRARMERDKKAVGIFAQMSRWGSPLSSSMRSWPVNVMCPMLDVSRSGYYDWRRRSPSARTTAKPDCWMPCAGSRCDIKGDMDRP